MFKRITLIILLGGLTTGLAFWQIQTPDMIQSTLAEDNWKLHRLPHQPNMAAIANRLRNLKPWEEREVFTKKSVKSKKKKKKKQKKNALNLVGIIQQEPNSYILLLDSKNKVTPYEINSSLPNGASLRAIYNDSIEVMDYGETEIIKLYD